MVLARPGAAEAKARCGNPAAPPKAGRETADETGVNSPAEPIVVRDDPPRFGVASQSLRWPDDPQARVTFVLKDHTAYVIHITRGTTVSGTQILQAFRGIAGERRVKVLAVDFLTIGFWEKMVERKLVDDWGMENPEMLL
jgi:hypothetical protein